jgi:site-specific DNA recombinase
VFCVVEQWIAIYTRLSRDRTGRAENVGTQDHHGRAYAERLWPGIPIKTYSDNDLTAADPGTFRPDYARLLYDITAGHVLQVVSADQDRLTRQPSEWEELMPILALAGIKETHGYRDGVTPVELGKRTFGRIKALMGADYVEGIKVKVNEKLDALAAQGRPGPGNTFGYRRTINDAGQKALEVVPELAEQVRWAADAVLAGWSLTDIAREMESRGVPTKLGGRWTHDNARGMLVSPAVAGLRVHRGEIVGRGNWEAILDEATWRQVTAKLSGTRTVRNGAGARQIVGTQRRTARKYLLSGGTAVCGRCGAALTGRLQNGRAGRRPIYACITTNGGCNRLGINAVPLEDHVRDRLVEWLQTPEFAAAMAADDFEARRRVLTGELRAIEQQDVELSKRWASGQLREAAWDAARADLDARHAEVSAKLAGIPVVRMKLDPELLLRAWGGMNLGEKRQVIGVHVERVTVSPAKPGAKAFDPGRVAIAWKA